MASEEPGPEKSGIEHSGIEQSEQTPATEQSTPSTVERARWSRTVIIGAAALAVLLLGAMVGLLLSRSLTDDAATTPGAGSVEVGFAQDMSVHHLQAVTMANWARDHSTDPEIKQLAFDITSTQTEQIGRMKGWLMLWDQPEQSSGAYMAWMGSGDDHGHGGMVMPEMSDPAMPGSGMAAASAAADGAVMPGMATNEELAKMRSLTGKALDVDFLQLMLRHHQGGIGMAQYANQHSSIPAVKQLTQSILTSQGAEIDLMTSMLAARGAQPLPN
jgi:uncharacterized protein (DUF305 family)